MCDLTEDKKKETIPVMLMKNAFGLHYKNNP